MPLVKISLRKGQNAEYKTVLLSGVHSALGNAYLVPDSEIYQQIYELDATDFQIPASQSDQFVIIEIIAFPGRSFDAKKYLYEGIVQNLGESLKIPGSDILIILHEPPMENWGVHGGKPASEVDLGFKVAI